VTVLLSVWLVSRARGVLAGQVGVPSDRVEVAPPQARLRLAILPGVGDSFTVTSTAHGYPPATRSPGA
jgi:hypothetical protein